jgi:hypothetical protein
MSDMRAFFFSDNPGVALLDELSAAAFISDISMLYEEASIAALFPDNSDSLLLDEVSIVSRFFDNSGTAFFFACCAMFGMITLKMKD